MRPVTPVTPVTVPQPTEVTEVTEVEAKQVTEVEAASNSFSTDRGNEGNEGNKGNTEFDATGAASRGSADFLPRTLEELQVDGEGEIGTEPTEPPTAPTAPLPDGRADESPSVKKAMLLLPEGAISPKANIEPEAGTGATGSASPKSPVSPTPSNTSNRPSSAAPSGLELSSLDDRKSTLILA